MEKKKIWIDCDPGIDDALALIYALKSDDYEIMGISVTSGNVSAQQGYLNLQTVLKLLDMEVDFPIGYYESVSCVDTAEDTHGADGLGNYNTNLDSTHKYRANVRILDKMYETIVNNPQEVTLVCLGPQNWVCKFTDDDLNSIRNYVKDIYLMGGCYMYPGNCSPVTEFNFWANPTGAEKLFRVFENCKKIRVVSLEATHFLVLTRRDVARIVAANEKIGEFVSKITKFYMDFHKLQEDIDGCVINDPLVFLAMDGDCVTFEDYYVKVIPSADNVETRGQFIVDRKRFYKHLPNASVSISCGMPSEFIMQRFIEGITK